MHAEELGVRYSDARIPPPRPFLQKAGARLREQCIASLLALIARHHSVPWAEVAAVRGARDERWDVAVPLAFALLYGFAAWRLVRWIANRFGEAWWPTLIAIVTTSVATSAVGVVAGGLWAGLMESARLGWTGHMSFRGA